MGSIALMHEGPVVPLVSGGSGAPLTPVKFSTALPRASRKAQVAEELEFGRLGLVLLTVPLVVVTRREVVCVGILSYR